MSDHGRMHLPGPDVAEGSTSGPEASRPPAGPQHRYPRVTSFRTRRTTLSAAQQATWNRLWPEIGMQARDGDVPAPLVDTDAWFGRSAPVVVEIGCGAGTSTLAMAKAEPDLDVVAVEVYRRGLAQLLSGIEREGVPNIRLVRGDGVDVLQHMFGPGSLTGVRVFFPDPWPKARHHKRRLLQPATVGLIADRLRPGGVFHAATDHAGYAEQIAEVGDAEPRLRRVSPSDALPISVERPVTKYEGKAQHAGSAVTELLWERL
ncbi:tRNA (guanine-N7)-methyltransferase [Mycolicibacterium novocastrense]|uniref:tRNA (guanosine(46)-N7)-methyltransferase TrmB n=1 Tax=Mycolicibacterium novocastrense TaxID=59813 RepID=UPI0007466901|nr:tRNA (guanosine(46)-N7)-methyltransferase TrmB [Mycolicibacterium novocastrense]KUH66440.1 tRNA (guanine-N7)-methyltransferase [Mycolicibacterium novocastrense]KUH72913.1 tRNA (guanine-N7)-methyltransferase [Mycolicibacterium novocastrense]KUH75047.1 tRNA (guanine-N7)-methyltransferase [Mycolicibacterium novocastrense]